MSKLSPHKFRNVASEKYCDKEERHRETQIIPTASLNEVITTKMVEKKEQKFASFSIPKLDREISE
jgi:hypothetical protein